MSYQDIDDEIAELDREEADQDAFLGSISGDFSISVPFSHRFRQVVEWFGGHKTQEQFAHDRQWEERNGYPYLDD